MGINLLKEKTSFDTVLLQHKYTDYLRLLSDNELVLRIVSELKEKASGNEPFEIGYLRINAEAMLATVQKIIARLNRISGNKYRELDTSFAAIRDNIDCVLSKKNEIPVDAFVRPFDGITADSIASVGGKNAQLGEIKNKLGLPVPDGFAITAYAYKVFLESGGLGQGIEQVLAGLDVNDFPSTTRISRRIQDTIRNSPLPADLVRAIEDQCRKLAGSGGSCAVRSSAAGESTEFSFAGQYTTLLNVPAGQVAQAYKDVVASRFSPRALFYLTNRGFRQDDVAMSVGCMRMVRAKSSGVIHTVNPFAAGQDVLIINALWGLGTSIVEGDAVPDLFVVAKKDKQILESRIADKASMLTVSDTGARMTALQVPEKTAHEPSLREPQIRELADWAVRIEDHYHRPQIIEWACDDQDRLFVLQATPLGIPRQDVRAVRITSENHRLLIRGAETASSGAGYGPAFFADTDEDISNFPNGGIAVVRHSSPKFVSIMNRAGAIVADIGSPTGHMATLAREFQIPTLVNARGACAAIKNGTVISVDADHGCIYEGYVGELFQRPRRKNGIFKDTPALTMMNRLLEYVTPLNLIDPNDPAFTVQSVHTLHDIVRFAHQASMNEMFLIAQNVSVDRVSSTKLKTAAGFEVYIIDLGGGLKRDDTITEASVISLPFVSFWAGIKKGGVPPRPVSAGGFASVLMNTMANPQLQDRLFEKNLALIGDEYMNFNIRMGYHISTVEGLCTRDPNDNYVRFIFQGGGADYDRRVKRARMIAAILQEYQFSVKQTDDVVRALSTKCERTRFTDIMTMLGRLTLYTKQLDMLMPPHGMVLADYVALFLGELKRG